MKPQHARSWKYYRRQAFTLAEVVASLMLLGTLLVGMLVAHRRHAAQIRSASARLMAVAEADKLLTQWRAAGVWGSSSSSGVFADHEELRWRWKVTDAPELRRIGAAIGQLEIFSNTSEAGLPLARVEVITSNGGESR